MLSLDNADNDGGADDDINDDDGDAELFGPGRKH